MLEAGETTHKAGEIGVVRGGNHALANRTGLPAVVELLLRMTRWRVSKGKASQNFHSPKP